MISFQQAVGGSLVKVQRVTEEIDEDVEPILLPRNPVEVVVPALKDITVPADYRPSFLSSEPDQLSSSDPPTFIPQTPASQGVREFRDSRGDLMSLIPCLELTSVRRGV